MVIRMKDAEILRRGLDAFAELGYDAASVRELGRRIGVNHNFLNDRYGSKLDFWRAVVDFAIAELEPGSLEDDSDEQSSIAGRVRGLYRTAAQRPQLYRLIWDEATRDSERLDYLCENYLRPAVTEALPGAEEALRSRGWGDIPVHLLYFVLTGALSGIVQAPLANRLGGTRTGDHRDEPIADALAEFVLAGLLGSRDS
ncbi:TetR/AcrR family transcriptional regulator [Compostimonas suwonensis]|uniref:AcrR family transcriptional regulator n=1 Tax=Compostimonas suwonensis TaxID=1048394 RepID=A0A2M9C0G4_9MICO|nr:TetR/AcrR family transcriptional regulator [Compostimonas suwonensis]PJJ63841.1 AcrR family transcriptional regulator [Compostimonas suwonensis]